MIFGGNVDGVSHPDCVKPEGFVIKILHDALGREALFGSIEILWTRFYDSLGTFYAFTTCFH